MRDAAIAWLFLGCWLLAPDAAVAQNEQLCRDTAIARGQTAEGVATAPCFVLANLLIDARSTPAVLSAMLGRVPPRDVQSRVSGEAAKAGSAGQSEAVPTVQPMALAGGSVSAVGSDGGSDAIAAFTLNPAILFGLGGTTRTAELSRLIDLTVFVPINELDRDQDGEVDYYGVRARLNITGPASGRRMIRDAASALAEITQQEADISAALETALVSAPDFDGCIVAVESEPIDMDAVRNACGGEVGLTVAPATFERFRAALARARDEADSRYVGLDLRYDNGDPTLGAEDAVSSTTLFAGLAFGRRFAAADGNGVSFGFKGRAGAAHVSVDDPSIDESMRTNFALDGAFGFDFSYPYEFRPLTIAAALEFRTGDPPVEDMDEAFRTNFLMLRLAVDVPFAGGNTLSLGFGKTLSGETSSALSVGFNWQMLFAGLEQAAGN